MIDARVPPEHVKVIRSKIGPESAEKCRDVQNKPIRANFRKKVKGVVSKPVFQTPLLFFDTNCSMFKIHYEDCTLVRLKDI
jgi:hypothetical protein